MKRLIALSWGCFCILFGITLLVWVGYNLLVERLPETEGKNPLPAIALGIGAIGVGIVRVRKKQSLKPRESTAAKPSDRLRAREDEDAE